MILEFAKKKPCHSMLILAHVETKHFIYFYVGTLAILIWKS